MTTLHREALQAALLRKKREGMSAVEKWFLWFAVAIAAMIAWMMAASANGAEVTNVIPATLRWSIVTNWSDSPWQTRTLMGWTGDKDPNITTYHEEGIIRSNLIAFVEWKGVTSSVVVETVFIGTTQRSYTIQTETKRIYAARQWHSGCTDPSRYQARPALILFALTECTNHHTYCPAPLKRGAQGWAGRGYF